MPRSTSLAPLPQGGFGPPEARHLLRRAGYAAALDDVRRALRDGLEATVDRLLNYRDIPLDEQLALPDLDADVIRPRTQEERTERRRAYQSRDPEAIAKVQRQDQQNRQADRRMHRDLQTWWGGRILATPRPLEEKLTLLWHGHFASRWNDVRDAYLMAQQHALLRREADGSFADLARAIVRDPAMLKFLNNDRNNRRRPNENLARELMELFTLGEGQYAEADIREGARALTGYFPRDNGFQFRQNAHDGGDKTILGVTGEIDGDDFVEILLRRKACSRFVALKLYRAFVADVPEYVQQLDSPTTRVVSALGGHLRSGKYRLKPTLKTLFMSRAFYDPAVMANKIKDPAEVVASVAHPLGLPDRGPRGVVDAMSEMGMELFNPPTVAGWEGGRAWINTTTLFVRQNTAAWLITGMRPNRPRFRSNQVKHDPSRLLADLDEPSHQEIVDRFCAVLVAPQLSDDRKAPLLALLADRAGGSQRTPSRDDLIALLTLITAMPEHQLC
ncbi:MAG: DUF1800 domain-containing protein [Planctomycetota bacterium]